MRDSIRSAVLILTALLVASVASALPTVELIWTGTTGAGTIGTDTIEAQPGDVLSLDVVIHDDGSGLAGYDLTLAPMSLSFVSSQDCPTPPNPSPGGCFGFPPIFLPGDPLNFQNATTTPVFGSGALTVGRAVFTAGGAGQVDVSGSLIDGAFNALFASDQAFVVPEPSSLALLGLGLGAMALERRRRIRVA